MRTFKQLLVISAIFLLLNGCDDEGVTPIPKWTWSDTDRSFEELEITPGATIDVVLETPNAPYEYAFTVDVPNTIDEVNGNPLVLQLHGGVGGRHREAHKGTCLLPVFESVNAFVISPNADGVQWYDVYNQEKVFRILQMAFDNWPIDNAKLVVTGYSDGANGTWFYSEVYPKIFSAGIAMASSYNTETTKGKARRIETPLYVIHGSEDELFPVTTTQYWVDRTNGAGSDVTFVVADGLSHVAPCDEIVGYFEDAVIWLQEEVWQ